MQALLSATMQIYHKACKISRKGRGDMTSDDYTESRFSADEVERDLFYKLPQNLVHSKLYRGVSSDAKLLYSVLLDRYQLSLKNNWVDDDGKVYIVYTREDICEMLHRSMPTVRNAISQLKEFKLIEEIRMGQGHANHIYVLKTVGKYTYPQRKNQTEKNLQSRKKKTCYQEGKKFSPNNTEFNNTDFNNNLSIVMDTDGNPISSYSEVFGFLCVESNLDNQIIDSKDNLEKELYPVMITCLTEMICSTDGFFNINKAKIDKTSIIKKTMELIHNNSFGTAIGIIVRNIAQYQSQKKVKNTTSFYRTCLWNGLTRSEADFESYFQRTYYYDLPD